VKKRNAQDLGGRNGQKKRGAGRAEEINLALCGDSKGNGPREEKGDSSGRGGILSEKRGGKLLRKEKKKNTSG